MRDIHRAIVVDDQRDTARLAARALNDSGLTCDIAFDGRDAWERIQQRPYDIVVSDIRMPIEYGDVLCRRVLDLTPRPIVVVVTAVDDQKILSNLIRHGVDDVCLKPVKFNALASRIGALLTRRDRRRERQRQDRLTNAMSTVVQDYSRLFDADSAQSPTS